MLHAVNEQIKNISDFINKKEIEFNDFYFLLNILYFTIFVKNLPILKGEKINRLSYSFEEAYKKLKIIDFSKFKIKTQDYKIYLNIIDNYFQCLDRMNEKIFNKKITSFFIIFILYREILRFYSKIFFWQRNIKIKINDIITSCISDLSKLIQKSSDFNNIYEYYNFISYILKNNVVVKYIKERQSFKKYKNYFNEFDKIRDISYLNNKEDVLNLVNNASDNNIIIDFIQDMKYLFS
jgi:hypothetical protein